MSTRRRRICWPNPDKVCLEGGCGHCVDGSLVSLSNIHNYALQHGWLKSYLYGLSHGNVRITP